MKLAVTLIGFLFTQAGIFLPVDRIIGEFLPAEYGEYADNYERGLTLLRGLMLGGGIGLMVFGRWVAGLFQSESVSRPVSTIGRPALREVAVMAVVGVGGFLLCLPRYTQGFTFDEVFLVNAILTENPVKMFVHPSGSTHVLNSLPANILAHLFGASEAVCRFPALCASVISPLVLWAVVRRLTSPRIALLAAALLAMAPLHVWYAQEAKGNAWLVLMVLLSWYGLIRLAERWQGWMAAAYGVSLFLMTLAHLSGVMLILATIPVFLLPSVWRPFQLSGAKARQLVILHLLAAWAAAMFYAPIVPFMLGFSKEAHLTEGRAELFPLLRDMVIQFTCLDWPWLSLLATVFIVLGCCRLWKSQRGMVLFLFLPAVLDLAVTLGFGLFSFPRYHMYLFPAFLLLIALGAGGVRWRELLVVLLFLPPLLSYYSEPKSNLRDLAAIADSRPAGQIVHAFGSSKRSFPASGLVYYTERFDADDTIRGRVTGPSADTVVDLLVIDTLHFEAANAPFAAFVKERGEHLKTFHCLGELDQFRVRTSDWYQIKVAALMEWYNATEKDS